MEISNIKIISLLWEPIIKYNSLPKLSETQKSNTKININNSIVNLFNNMKLKTYFSVYLLEYEFFTLKFQKRLFHIKFFLKYFYF